jgi:four helix bundle protein
LTSQLRRAAVSVGSNITEGAARDSLHEFARFLEMARASASECSFHLQLARDLEYITDEDNDRFQAVSTGLRRQLTLLRNRVLRG